MKYKRIHPILAALIAIATAQAHAQLSPPSDRATILQTVGLDQKLESQVPLETRFRDENGNTVALSEYFDGKPIILTLNYYQCPMLCTEVLNGLTGALNALKFEMGRDFNVVTISIDPRETPAMAEAKKATYLARYRRAGAEQGWHFLTGEKNSIDAVAKAVGYRYAYDPAYRQYAHPSAIVVLTPKGRVSKYFYGVEYAPKDLRLGLVEASQERIGSVVDQILLLCYHYDPATGKYTPEIMLAVRAGGALTLLGLGVFIGVLIRKDVKRNKRQGRAA